jgi:hypothetical protein
LGFWDFVAGGVIRRIPIPVASIAPLDRRVSSVPPTCSPVEVREEAPSADVRLTMLEADFPAQRDCALEQVERLAGTLIAWP